MLPTELPQQIANGIFQGAIYALFATGYALIFGVLDVLNLAHAAIFMWGAMVAWWLMAVVLLPLPAALLLATLFAGVLGVVLDRVAFAPLRRRAAPHLSPLISSLAVATILQGLAFGFFGADVHTYPPSALSSGVVTLGSVVIGWVQLLVLALAVVLMLLVRWLIRATRYGRAVRAIAENPRAARLLGIHVERAIGQTFFLASALGGVAGVLYGLTFNSAVFSMGEPVELRGLAIIILGGMGSIPGAVVGGFALALVEVFSVAFLASQYRDAIAFAVLFLVLVLRPTGLFGRLRVREA
jgi:branched-chain amino acid transport system permease protein